MTSLDLWNERSYMKAMSAGRPLEFDPEKATDAAVELFWRKGYEATSLAELVDAMAISRSSLYQAFGSKKELFERCLLRYADSLSSRMKEALEASPSGRQFIEDTFDAVASTAQRPAGARGCLIANSASEIGQSDPVLAVPVADGLRRFTQLFTEAVRRGQAEGDVAANADPRAVGTYLVGAMNGLRTMIKAGADRRTARGMVELTMRALD